MDSVQPGQSTENASKTSGKRKTRKERVANIKGFFKKKAKRESRRLGGGESRTVKEENTRETRFVHHRATARKKSPQGKKTGHQSPNRIDKETSAKGRK